RRFSSLATRHFPQRPQAVGAGGNLPLFTCSTAHLIQALWLRDLATRRFFFPSNHQPLTTRHFPQRPQAVGAAGNLPLFTCSTAHLSQALWLRDLPSPRFFLPPHHPPLATRHFPQRPQAVGAAGNLPLFTCSTAHLIELLWLRQVVSNVRSSNRVAPSF